MSHEQNAPPSHNIKTGKGMESIRSVVKFRCLRTAITNQNYIHEKKWVYWTWGMPATVTFSIFCLSHLLSKIIKMNLYISISLSVLYGCEAWSVLPGEEHMLRVYKHRALSKIFGPIVWHLGSCSNGPDAPRYLGLRRMCWQGTGGDCVIWSFMVCVSCQMLFGWSRSEEQDGWGYTYQCAVVRSH
jgi:hypothetical protein